MVQSSMGGEIPYTLKSSMLHHTTPFHSKCTNSKPLLGSTPTVLVSTVPGDPTSIFDSVHYEWDGIVLIFTSSFFCCVKMFKTEMQHTEVELAYLPNIMHTTALSGMICSNLWLFGWPNNYQRGRRPMHPIFIFLMLLSMYYSLRYNCFDIQISQNYACNAAAVARNNV